MPARAPSDPDTAMMLGEMKAKIQELVHQNANRAMKDDAIARSLARLETLPGDIAEIKDRLTALEADQHRREGERGLWNTLLRSPWLAWIFAAAVVAWSWFKDRGQ